MADKKTGSARRMRDEDDAPKKKQSGAQKSLKKSTSSKKPIARDDDDDDDAPKARKGSARNGKGDSTREGAAPPKRGPDKGRIFLMFVPGVMLILLGVGYYVSQLPDKEGPKEQKINFDDKVEEARKKFNTAKTLIVEASKPEFEGKAGVPKLAESYKLMCEAHNIIQGVRNDLEKLSKDPNVKMDAGKSADEKKATSTGYAFDPLDTEIQAQKVGLRKLLNERPGGQEAISQYVKEDQAEAEKNKGSEDWLLSDKPPEDARPK